MREEENERDERQIEREGNEKVSRERERDFFFVSPLIFHPPLQLENLAFCFFNGDERAVESRRCGSVCVFLGF